MLQLKSSENKYWYSLLGNPLARVMKFDRFMDYFESLSGGENVLDYGSGDRPYESLFRKKFEKYIAADYEVTNLKHGRKPDIYITDAGLDLPESSVDCILLTEVLEHLYEPKIVLQDLYRVLKPGGLILGTVPFAVQEHEQPYDFHRYTYFGLEKMFLDAGYKIIHLEYVGDMIGVGLSVAGRIAALFLKGLRKYHLGWLASVLNVILKVPEYGYYYLSKSVFNPQKINYLRSFPLGFTFMLEKPVQGKDQGGLAK